jgi:Rrf2 family transcriptional regulator, cysteine metabolism repressor
MPLLTRKVDYAILVLNYLHHHAEGGCAREIADRFHISRAFVANILKELCQKGFVASHRGVKGGYAMLRPAREVSLADVLDALEDQPVSLAACNEPPAGDGCSVYADCPVKGPIAEVHQKLRDVLRGVTLGDLFRERRPAGTQLLTLGI